MTYCDRKKYGNFAAEPERPVNSDSCPLSVLRKLHPYPISCLAMLGKGALSGSQSLEVFCPGNGTTEESDFDIYHLADPEAIIDVMHTLRFAHVQWNNFMTTYYKQISTHGVALVPQVVFFDLKHELQVPSEMLKEYLISRFKKSEYINFFTRFSDAYRIYTGFVMKGSTGSGIFSRTKEERRKDDEERVWVVKAHISEFRIVPKDIGLLLKHCNSYNNFKLEIELEKVKSRWKEMGWPEILLAGYMKSRLIADVGPITPRQRSMLVYLGAADDIGGVYGQRTFRAQSEEMEFQILQGTLPSNAKIQLMLVPAKMQNVFYIPLGFYATHLVSAINSNEGYHLYHDSAKEKISYEIDVSSVHWKHARCAAAIEKYKLRGWTFKPLHKGWSCKSGSDEGVKMVCYEEIYRAAATEENKELPLWWDTHFKSRRDVFQMSSWVEQEGAITETDYNHERSLSEENLLQWVQDALANHKDVIPKDLWDKREEKEWTELDLWFGGATALARQMACIRKYTRDYYSET
jgi:hypothetical protein